MSNHSRRKARPGTSQTSMLSRGEGRNLAALNLERPPPLDPVHPDDSAHPTRVSMDAGEVKLTFRQILHEAISGLPRKSGISLSGITTPISDHVVGALPPAVDGRPTTQDVSQNPSVHPDLPITSSAITHAVRTVSLERSREESNVPEAGSGHDSSSLVRTESKTVANSVLAAPQIKAENARTPSDLAVMPSGNGPMSRAGSGVPVMIPGIGSASGDGLRHNDGTEQSPQPLVSAFDQGRDLASRPHATTAFTESQGTSETGRTNALFEQILDELRKLQQPSSITSGRSVYPER